MSCINKSKLDFINHIRMLWEQHSTWTGMASTSIIFHLPNKEFVLNQLLHNPVDFAKVLCTFYGEKTSSIFGTLLTEHLMLAGDLIKAIMIDNSDKVNTIKGRWYENTDEISNLLSSISPLWHEKFWKEMLYNHLGFIENMAVYLFIGDYEKSILTYNKLEQEALKMADTMSSGIIRQFPCKFR